MSRPALSGNGIQSFVNKVLDLRILDSTKSTLLIEATVNVTNPTNYSINIPYVDIHLLSNGTVLGSMIAQNMLVSPGINNHTIGLAKWDPAGLSGDRGIEVGRELLSQFISGKHFRTTIDFALIVQATTQPSPFRPTKARCQRTQDLERRYLQSLSRSLRQSSRSPVIPTILMARMRIYISSTILRYAFPASRFMTSASL